MRERCVLDVHEVLDDDQREATSAPFGAFGAFGPRTPSSAPPRVEGEGLLRSDFSIPNLIAGKMKSKSFFWSVELIPGTTPHLQSLLEKSLKQLAQRPPTFASVTWHVSHLRVVHSGVPSGGALVAEHPALQLSQLLQDKYRIPALMHLSAGKMTREEVTAVLESCLAAGVNNIFAVRGDEKPDVGADFHHTSDLVHYMRKSFGSKFNIGVAGYPSGHPESKSKAEDLFFLKEKVDAGADFILTQVVTSCEEFCTFKQNCNELGMKVPIIPGLILIQSYNMFENLVQICNLNLQGNILQELKQLNEKKKEMKFGEDLLQSLMSCLVKCCPGAHLFTMNRTSDITKFLSYLSLLQDASNMLEEELNSK